MKKLRIHLPWTGAALALVAGTCTGAHAADCTTFTGVTIADSTVTTASVAHAGDTVQGQKVPADFCRVQGVAKPSPASEIKWEVWLPLTEAAWTGRMKVNGTGGYSGATPYNRLAQDIGDGFVTAGSNMGHDGGENYSWTFQGSEKVKDWGLRAHYSVATAAKTLARSYYGSDVKHSYFEGCSNGGRQAMMMAQNYPDLFDGIVAGAPSMFYPDLLMWLVWTGKVQLPTAPLPAGPLAIPDAKRALITQRVLAACDANDGLADGQITNPRACKFDINTMGPAPAGDGSLTASELDAVKKMYAGTHNEITGAQLYTGALVGSENDWIPSFADNGGYGNFIGHYVYGVQSYDWRNQANWNTVYDQVKQALTPVTAAPSPDIRKFVAHGGKLIHVHGLNDPVVPPEGSIGYLYALTQWEKLRNLPDKVVDAQVEKLDAQTVAATANAFGRQVRDYHRLFMLPATAHCGNSTGPNSIGGGMPEPPKEYRDADHHAVSAVIKWVEEGVAPEKIIATKFDKGQLVRSRPICPWPSQAVYNGSGDINDAANFSCSDIKLRDYDVKPGDLVHIRNSLSQRKVELPSR